MDEMSILRKSNEILQQQNSDLAESLQHWKSEYVRLEMEKIDLLRENIKYRQQASRWKNIEHTFKQNIAQSLSSIINSASQIKQAVDSLDNSDNDLIKKISPLPTRSPIQSNASNVHHVHPMIQGVTIKKPIVRISRTCLNSLAKSQSLVVDDSNNIVQALVEESSEEGNNDDVPVVAQITNSPRKIIIPRDLYVSLSRMDSHDLIVCRNEGSSSQTVIEETTEESQGTSDSQNSGYSEEQEVSANIISGEPYEYKSRLERISEEPEDSGVNWINSRRKLNNLIVTDSLEEDCTKANTSTRTPNKNSKDLVEDPMEGTSWHFNTEHVNIRSKFKSDQKDISSEILIGNENSMEGSQVPDSTTNVTTLRDSQEQDQSFVKSFPSVMEFQSTPMSTLQKKEIDNELLCCTKSPQRECSNEYPIEVKVVLSKIGSNVSHSVSCKKIIRTKKRKSKASTGSEGTPKGKKKRKKSSIIESSLKLHSSDDGMETDVPRTSRTRRGVSKDYKEKPLNKKLRRSK